MNDVKGQMTDVFFDEAVPVRKGVPISIGVRFTVEDQFFCQTYLGYNPESIDDRVRTNERGAFKTQDAPSMCTK